MLEVHNLDNCHDKLVKEMKCREYNRYSEVNNKWKFVEGIGIIDKEKKLYKLTNRCSRCKKRYSEIIDNNFEQANEDG